MAQKHSLRTIAVRCAIAVLLIGGVFAAFWPALNAEFVNWDDDQIITGNTAFRGLSAEHLRWMFTTNMVGHYQPLTWVSYAVDYACWGVNAQGFHLTNLVLHGVNAVLVFTLGLRLMRLAGGQNGGRVSPHDLMGAAVGAALYAIHPLRVESVAWVTERRDLLSGMFLLLATLAYLRAVEPGKIPVRSRSWTVVATVALALSILSKAWGMSFFVVALVLDWYPLRRIGWEVGWSWRSAERLILQKTPFIALGVFAAFAAAQAQYGVIATKSLGEWGMVERVVQGFYGLGFYVWKSVVPIGLSPLYGLRHGLRPWEGVYFAAYATVVGGGIAAWLLRRRVPGVMAAAVVYAVLLAPVLGVLQSGEQFVADRYSYLACIGISVLAGAGVAWAARRAGRVGGPAVWGVAVATIAFVLGPLTYAQTTHWKDTLSLWSYAMTVTPTSDVRRLYAVELAWAKRYDEAQALLEQAVKDRPAGGMAWLALGGVFEETHRYADAERCLLTAIKTMKESYIPRTNLAMLYLRMNRRKDAVEMMRAAVADVESGGRRVLSALPYLALGDLLKKTGDRAGAREAYTKALGFGETRERAERSLAALDGPG